MLISWKPTAVILAFFTCTGGVNFPQEAAMTQTTHVIDLRLEPAVSYPRVVTLVPASWLEDRIVDIYKRPRSQAREIAGAIIEASKTFNIHWEILSSMVGTESSFDPQARSFEGAIGPLQVRPQVWGHLGYDLANTRQNVLAGAYILQGYKAKCGGWGCAIAAYNVGITNFMGNRKIAAQHRSVEKVGNRMRLWKGTRKEGYSGLGYLVQKGIW